MTTSAPTIEPVPAVWRRVGRAVGVLGPIAAGVVFVVATVLVATLMMRGSTARFSQATPAAVAVPGGTLEVAYTGLDGSGQIVINNGQPIGAGYTETFDIVVRNDSTATAPSAQTDFRLYPVTYQVSETGGSSLAGAMQITFQRAVGRGTATTPGAEDYQTIYNGTIAGLNQLRLAGTAIGGTETGVATLQNRTTLVNGRPALVTANSRDRVHYRITVTLPAQNAGGLDAASVGLGLRFEGRSRAQAINLTGQQPWR